MRSLRAGDLVEGLREHARQKPEADALRFLDDEGEEESRLSFGEIDRRARAIAATLEQYDAADERLLLLYPPGTDFITAFFGCLYAGAVAVPAYPPHPARLERTLPRLRAVVADSRPRLVLADDRLAGLLRDALGCHGAARRPAWVLQSEALAGGADAWSAPPCGPARLAFIQYTSGSTAAPKGVALSHSNLLANIAVAADTFGLTERGLFASWLPPYHDMGLIGATLTPLLIGGSSVQMSPYTFLKRPIRWLEMIARHRATTSGGPNFAYELCVRKTVPEERGALDLSSWTVAFNGSERVRSDTLERFAKAFAGSGLDPAALCPCYGLAEATLVVSGCRPGRPPVTRTCSLAELEVGCGSEAVDAAGTVPLVSSGRIVRDHSVVIVDPKSGAELPEGRVGEIWASGPSIAAGYWGWEEARSAGVFRARPCDAAGPGRYLRTGDCGFLSGGELFVTGRLRDLIVIRGRNLHPEDVERCAEASHPALRPGCGAAFACDSGDGLVVAQEIQPGDGADPAAIAAGIRRAVTETFGVRVHDVALLPPRSIPKTSSGKIQRSACRRAYADGSLARIHAPARPRGQSARRIQRWLEAWVSRELEVPPEDVDPRLPFSDFGLDSSHCAQLVGELEQWLGSPVPATHPWDHPSIELLSRELAA